MPTTKMGFEGEIFYGTAGSTAATRLTNVRDITYNFDTERGDTTVRGNSSSPPIGTNRVTRLNATIDFTMIVDSSDTELEALRVAAVAGNAVALRLKDYSSGKGYDGDVTLTMRHGKPIGGEQTIEFSAEPTRGEGRDPQLYV